MSILTDRDRAELASALISEGTPGYEGSGLDLVIVEKVIRRHRIQGAEETFNGIMDAIPMGVVWSGHTILHVLTQGLNQFRAKSREYL